MTVECTWLDVIDDCIAVLGRHVSVGQALAEINQSVVSCTADALHNALRRHRNTNATACLKRTTGAGPRRIVPSIEPAAGPPPLARTLPSVTPRHLPDLASGIIVSDVHVPYHSRDTWAVMERTAKLIKPKWFVINGDFLDCYPLSFFPKDPSRHGTFQQEVNAGKELLRRIEGFGCEHLIYISGNHEFRLPRYIAQKCPELFGMFSIPDLLELEAHGWKWIDYRHHTKIGSMRISHELGICGVYAIQRSRDTICDDMVIGHVHRAGAHWAGDADGRIFAGASFGWMGDLDKVDYEHKLKVLRTHVQGFGTFYVDEERGKTHIVPVPVIDGRAVVHGQLLEAA